MASLYQQIGGIFVVSDMLGFSEQNAFNHTFKRSTGETPKQHQQTPPSQNSCSPPNVGLQGKNTFKALDWLGFLIFSV